MESLSLADPTRSGASEEDNGDVAQIFAEYEYTLLNSELSEQRFLVLYPCAGDKLDPEVPVRCSLVTQSLFDAEPYIAVKNSRGYRELGLQIEVDGKTLVMPAALAVFLRVYRDNVNPVRLWVRHICLDEADAEEQTEYWTRDFVDTMYAMASSIVDMDQFLMEMSNEGTLPSIYDSYYYTREKLWNEVDESLAHPTRIPNRLGFKPSQDSALDQYPYVPIDIVAGEIRILLIRPAHDTTAPIVSAMAHAPFYSHFFHALSYTWGRLDSSSIITINGQSVKVPQDLEKTLRAIRRPDGEIAIWIDALCIDQQNLQERNREVARMKDVFDYASIVVSYVGEANEETNLALKLIPALQMPAARMGSDGRWDLGGKLEPEDIPQSCEALYHFFSRRYFRRIWIIQEVALASCAEVMCGDRVNISFEKLNQANYNLKSMLRSEPRLAVKVDDMYVVKQDTAADPLIYISKIFYFRNLMSRGRGSAAGALWRDSVEYHQTWKGNTPGILEALILGRDFEATDAHDKIFGLWGLAADTAGLDFKPNYGDSLPKSYMDFVRAWCKQHGSLDIIAAAEKVSQSDGFYADAASWCPDWSQRSETSCMVRKERIPPRPAAWIGSLDGELYAANGGIKSVAGDFFSFQGSTLCATGIILDRIAFVFDELEKGPPNVSLPPPCPVTFVRYFHLGIEILRYYRQHEFSTYKDPLQAYVAMVHGDVPSAWLLPADHPEPDAEPRKYEQYVCHVKSSRHVLPFAGSYDRFEARAIMRSVLRGRALFVSEKGYMGLAPHYVREPTGKPWLLAVLAGCTVPVMLQENDDGSYNFGGACFVQGWMEGEYMAEQFGADDPIVFWAALQGSERLRIV